MKRYPMPKDYVKELNEHRYVEQATEWSVSFTAEFKQLVYDGEKVRGRYSRKPGSMWRSSGQNGSRTSEHK